MAERMSGRKEAEQLKTGKIKEEINGYLGYLWQYKYIFFVLAGVPVGLAETIEANQYWIWGADTDIGE